MIEEGIRGGITQALYRYCKANNKYMGKNHDENKKSTYLQWYDANGLYAWAITQKLPVDCFD